VSTLVRPHAAAPRALEGRYATPPRAGGLAPSRATMELVRGQVRALLLASPSWTASPEEEQGRIERNLVRIAGYAAECLREMCWQSEVLGQTPVLKPREPRESRAAAHGQLARSQPARAQVARAQAGDFAPRAAGQIGRIAEQTLRAIAFPTFVADLIRGTFNAIVQTSISQLEAFAMLLDNVSKTVDQFTDDNISDNQSRDWLAQRYPDHITISGGQAVARNDADEKPLPNFRRDLNLPDTVSSLDDDTIQSTLIPAARRRLAETRLQILSSLVLMGVSRIIVSGGKIRATMGFHIDTTDRTHEEHATDFDFRHAASARYGDSFGFSPWSVSASHSVSYVTSTRRQDDAEINVNTDLTGEVELHFKTDQIPLERFATGSTIGRIQGNTAVPEANTPITTGVAPFSEAPTIGGEVPRQAPRRTPKAEPILPKIGTPIAEPKMPTKPLPTADTRTDDEALTPMQKIELEKERRRRKDAGELVPEADKTVTIDEKEKGAETKDGTADSGGKKDPAPKDEPKGEKKDEKKGEKKDETKAESKPDATKAEKKTEPADANQQPDDTGPTDGQG
jgi:hypothetical protein